MRLAAFLILAAVAAACTPAVQYAPGPTAALAGGEAQTIQIFANGDWRDTGIRVGKGEVYRIAAEGRWSIAPQCGDSDANGIKPSLLCPILLDPLQLGVAPGTLIGRIGAAGKPFPVGSALTFTAAEDGDLFLACYDAVNWGDNSGYMNVTLARNERPRPAFPQAEIDQAIAQGAAAEARGDHAGAIAAYTAALKKNPTHLAAAQDLVERAIDAALLIRPPLELPPEAGTRAAAAVDAIQKARTGRDFAAARLEFLNALAAAPWWADGWFNLAVVDQQLGQPGEARFALESYLHAAPDARDRKDVESRIAALKAKGAQ